MNNLLIIGAGQIGRRHFQSLAKMKSKSQIYIVDPDLQVLKIAKQQTHSSAVCYYQTDLSSLPKEFNLAIVATNSDIRFKVLRQLLSQFKIKYFILEKVLFSNLSEYAKATKMLKTKKTRVWVDLICRTWPFYRYLKENLKDSAVLELRASGTNWGLGCNAIHFIDLLSYLSDKKEYEISTDFLDSQIISSKRKDFVEFTGTLMGKFSEGPIFSLTSYNKIKVPQVTEIIAQDQRYFIFEDDKKAFVAKDKNNWQWQKIDYNPPFLSSISYLNVQAILETGRCLLPTFEEASSLHLPLIKGFLAHLNKSQKGKKTQICPIT